MATATDTPPPPPLDLVVRFSTSHPDVILSIPSPSTTSTLSLKQQIRSHLSAPDSGNRLRLIHAGKVLPDTDALSRSLPVNSTPPPPQDPSPRSDKAKGKLPLRPSPRAVRLYIHCSIGDPLSPTDLTAETLAASTADAALALPAPTSPSTTTLDPSGPNVSTTTTTTTPAPRGFDRLLTAGFTPAEITHLRANFLAIQSHTHTPETMPTGPALLALEERWLDGTHNSGGEGEVEDSAGLEDMLWGNLMGFFWPVGAVAWLAREEGVWTRRRQVAVLGGFLVNVTFGFLRVMS